MSLDHKTQKFLDGTFKTVIFFAIIGAIVFLVAVHFIENMFKDMIGESTKISNPTTTKTNSSQSSSKDDKQTHWKF
jgi:hypothetical protein